MDADLFCADIAKFAGAIDISVTTAVKKIAMDAYNGIIDKTPVGDTGNLRASWMIGVNEEVESNRTSSTIEIDKLTGIRPGDKVIISNSLPYAEVVEYGLYPGSGPKTRNGYSTQAPKGMVRVTLAEIEAQMQIYLDSL